MLIAQEIPYFFMLNIEDIEDNIPIKVGEIGDYDSITMPDLTIPLKPVKYLRLANIDGKFYIYSPNDRELYWRQVSTIKNKEPSETVYAQVIYFESIEKGKLRIEKQFGIDVEETSARLQELRSRLTNKYMNENYLATFNEAIVGGFGVEKSGIEDYIYNYIKSYINGVTDKATPLLYGHTGVGKSAIMKAVVDRLDKELPYGARLVTIKAGFMDYTDLLGFVQIDEGTGFAKDAPMEEMLTGSDQFVMAVRTALEKYKQGKTQEALETPVGSGTIGQVLEARTIKKGSLSWYVSQLIQLGYTKTSEIMTILDKLNVPYKKASLAVLVSNMRSGKRKMAPLEKDNPVYPPKEELGAAPSEPATPTATPSEPATPTATPSEPTPSPEIQDTVNTQVDTEVQVEEVIEDDEVYNKLVYYAKTPIMFFDEINRTPEDILSQLMQIFSEREFSNHYTYKMAPFVAAANMKIPNDDNELQNIYKIENISDWAKISRFEPIPIDHKTTTVVNATINYLAGQDKYRDLSGVGELLEGANGEDLLYNPNVALEAAQGRDDAEVSEFKFPTFRGWEFVLDYVAAVKREKDNGGDGKVYVDVVKGAIGDRIPQSFYDFLSANGLTATSASQEGRDVYDVVVDECYKAGLPTMMLGRYGLAKTAKVNEKAEETGSILFKVELASRQRVDIKGYPRPVSLADMVAGPNADIAKTLKDEFNKYGIPGRTTKFYPFELAEKIKEAKRTGKKLIIFFDEVNRCDPIIQSAVFEAISEHRLMGVDFSDLAAKGQVRVVAAGNIGAGYNVTSMDAAAMARFVTARKDGVTEADVKKFLKWAAGHLTKIYKYLEGREKDILEIFQNVDISATAMPIDITTTLYSFRTWEQLDKFFQRFDGFLMAYSAMGMPDSKEEIIRAVTSPDYLLRHKIPDTVLQYEGIGKIRLGELINKLEDGTFETELLKAVGNDPNKATKIMEEVLSDLKSLDISYYSNTVRVGINSLGPVWDKTFKKFIDDILDQVYKAMLQPKKKPSDVALELFEKLFGDSRNEEEFVALFEKNYQILSPEGDKDEAVTKLVDLMGKLVTQQDVDPLQWEARIRKILGMKVDIGGSGESFTFSFDDNDPNFITVDDADLLALLADEAYFIDDLKDAIMNPKATMDWYVLNDNPYVLGDSQSRASFTFYSCKVKEIKASSGVEGAEPDTVVYETENGSLITITGIRVEKVTETDFSGEPLDVLSYASFVSGSGLQNTDPTFAFLNLPMSDAGIRVMKVVKKIVKE